MSNLLEQASLVMIPSGYKEDVVYSQIPLDGSGDLQLTRASNGTRINSAGLVEVCPWNIFQQSEDFSNAAWTKTNTTVTANSITAPNGTLTADLIVPANATDGVIVQASLSFIVGTSYSLSVYGKKEDFNFLLLALPSAAFPTSNRVALFDLNNGTIASSTQSGTGAVITDVGNGWYRCSITITATATTSANVVIAARSSNNLTSLGNGTDGIYIWGAQLNTGELKPYFPTTDRLNVPRLTYQNGGGGCPSLLLEKQSTNILLYSEDFDNGAWTPINASITANNTTSPDGTQNAEKLTEDSTNGVHLVYNTSGVSAGAGTWTLSVFYKKGTRRYFSIKLQVGSSSYTQVFDADGITTGASSSNGLTSVSTSIVSMGNGWVRATLTGTDASGGGAGYGIFSLSNSASPSFDAGNFNPTYQGTGTDYGYFWGAQLEAGSYATSYIVSTSSSATRVADACFKTGISSLIGQTEGTVFLDAKITALPTDGSLFGVQKTASNFVIRFGSQGSNIYAQCYNGSTNLFFETTSYTLGTRIKLGFAYKAGSYAFYVNGIQIATGTNATTIPACDELMTNSLWGNTNPSLYEVNEAILFPTRLTNAELAQLTA